LILYFDESGYTGQDLLNADQPIFVHASNNLTDDEARDLVSEFFWRSRAVELKHADLCFTDAGQHSIVRFLEFLNSHPGRFAAVVAHKRYVLVSLLVDFWVEPGFRQMGLNLYERGGNIALANLLYGALNVVMPGRAIDRFLEALQAMLRSRSDASYEAFGIELADARRRAPSLDKLFDLISDSNELLGGINHLRALPIRLTDVLGTTGILTLVSWWRARSDARFELIHDSSSALRRQKAGWEAILASDVPAAVTGVDRRTVTFPLRVDTVRLGDSKSHLQLQLADVVAGAVTSFFRNRRNGEESYRSAYVEQLADLPEETWHLVVNGTWPSTAINPADLGTEGPVLGDTADFIATVLQRKGVRWG
jgi:hypothetical protein